MTEQEQPKEERIIEMDVQRLRDFRNHPFKVREDTQYKQLTESIRHYGILNPLIVRPMPEGVYEIISGHRRKYAAASLGYRKVPVIIRILNDEDAIVNMVDANLQREEILPSEKAAAYKMKYDAIKRKGGRKKNGQNDHSLKGVKTIQIIGKELGDSAKQVQRYLKITELIPELQELLDQGKISFSPAFELAFLKEEEQRQFLEAMKFAMTAPSLSQAQRIKKLSQDGELTLDAMKDILNEIKKGEISRVVFKNEQLRRFFPKDYTIEQMKREILVILKSWSTEHWQ